MTFAGKVWKILVGIKDGLALLLLMLFFWMLFAVLTMRPSPAMVREGALYLPLDGRVVEEKARVDPMAIILSGQQPDHQYRVRDLVRALEGAAQDARIKAVVLDLEKFRGGGMVHLQQVGAAMDKVRAAKKPVLVRAAVYSDRSMLLAAHASEVWVDPLGGVMLAGPGGSTLYYKGLLDRLKVQAHVFRVGTYKSAVEPYERSGASPEAREASEAIYAALWNAWQADVKKARPKANIALPTTDPVGWLQASGGNAAEAAKAAGLVDRIGDRTAFGQRIAAIVGVDPGQSAGSFRHTAMGPFLADRPFGAAGKPIAVITIANEIVDGDDGPGVAGGDRIADFLDEAATGKYAGLVVRVDSPGGSVTASERIRTAVERMRASGLPVAVSMANYAASGGYWVSTPAQRIFAEPATITGSIGIFGVVPTFERTLADYGVSSDGVRTTPLSGQPDMLAGLTPEMKQVIQSQIEQNYGRFIGLVGKARGKSVQDIDRIAQGRVWDGGTARQLGLVDEFGGMEDALRWVAAQAKLADGEWHADYLGASDDRFGEALIALFGGGDSGGREGARVTDFTSFSAMRQQEAMARMGGDLSRLLGGGGAQALCLECTALERGGSPVAGRTLHAPGQPDPIGQGWFGLLARLL